MAPYHVRPHRWRRRRSACLSLTMLVCCLAGAAQAGAQTVRGRVLDAETMLPITTGVHLHLRDARGAVVIAAQSDANGEFALQGPRDGEYELRALHFGYHDTSSRVTLSQSEQLIVDVRLSASALALDPLTVTARRSTRHDASFEGMLARYEVYPKIGSHRVVKLDDPEMAGASRVNDVLRWLSPRPIGPSAEALQRGSPIATTGPREYDRTRCAVVFMNGMMIADELSTAMALDDPLAWHLEAVEYYRYWFEAPMEYRQTPLYLMQANMNNCSVIALWQRRTAQPRYLGAAQPFRGRLAAGSAWQQFGGRHAPAAAAGLRAELLWYARPNLAIGLHGRSTAAPVNAADLAELTSGAEGLGQRDYTVQLYGVESRLDLREVRTLTPFVTARFILGRRSFNSHRWSGGDESVSSGTGAGGGVGLERGVTRYFSVFAALDHERVSFQPFYDLHLPPDATRATWSTTSLRAGGALLLRK
jgi:hypothetical protein